MEKPCQFEKWYKKWGKALPLDKTGKCYFHSEDKNWKSQMSFQENFLELLEKTTLDESISNLDFCGIVFIGEKRRVKGFSIDTNKNKKRPNFDSKIILQNIHFKKSMSLTNITIATGLIFKDCIFEGVTFSSSEYESVFEFHKCKFYGRVVFDYLKEDKHGISFLLEACQFFDYKQEGNIFKSAVFFNSSIFWNDFEILNCEFNVECFFKNTKFKRRFEDVASSIIFKGNTFNKSLTFRQTRIDNPFTFVENFINADCNFLDVQFADKFDSLFSKLTINGTLNFQGTTQNKLFRHNAFFYSNKVEGNINFEHTYLKHLPKAQLEELFELSRQNKVLIGNGCIKYNRQTSVKHFNVEQGHQAIFIEIAQAFVNYFIAHNGFNLGIETTIKSVKQFSFFYFTDDALSQEEFEARLCQTEFSFWELLSPSKNTTNTLSNENQLINTIDGLSALISTFFRVGVRIVAGKWKTEDTESLLRVIQFNSSMVLVPKYFHKYLVQTYTSKKIVQIVQNNFIDNRSFNSEYNIKKLEKMKIKKIIAKDGGQITIVEKIRQYNQNSNVFSSDKDAKQFGTLLSDLSPKILAELKEIVQEHEEVKDEGLKFSLKEKAQLFLMENGVPISQSMTAATIFEMLKLAFIG